MKKIDSDSSKESRSLSSENMKDNQNHGAAVARLALYVLATIVISSVLLILNVGVVYAVFASIASATLSGDTARYVGQFVLFTGPFLLLFPEWLLYDLLVSPRRHKHK